MRYAMTEDPYIICRFTTGDTVTITIYDLSDDSKVVDGASMSEIGSTGYFKYKFDPSPTALTEYMYVADNSIEEHAGKIILGGYPDEIDDIKGLVDDMVVPTGIQGPMNPIIDGQNSWFIPLMDITGAKILSTDISSTGTYTIYRWNYAISGWDFLTFGNLSAYDGHVSIYNTFPATTWEEGDRFLITTDGGTEVTLGGDTFHIPDMVFYGIVQGHADVVNAIDDIKGTGFVKDTDSLVDLSHKSGTKGTDAIYDASGIIKGLVQENQYIDQQTYDGDDNLLTARIRTYSDAGDVGTDTGVLATYNLTATYSDKKLATYKVVRA